MLHSIDQIILERTTQGWIAHNYGPHSTEIVRLFGTHSLPTAFTARADRNTVLLAIQALNPTIIVRIKETL